MSQTTGVPQQQPQAPKKKGKKKWILLAVVVVVLIIIISNASKGGSSSSSSSASSSSASASTSSSGSSAKAAGMNQPVRDGKFEFTVTGMDCSKTTIGSDGLTKQAQGTWCIVSMTVKNIGDKAQMLDASSQKAFDAANRQYSTDSSAAMYLGDTNTFLNQLNPGSSVQGQIAYDVPAGTKLTKLQLHDSPFSGGVDVNLG